MTVVRFLYNVECVVGDLFVDHGETYIERYLVTCYTSWAYTKCFLKKRHFEKVMKAAVEYFADEYELAFTLKIFIRRYGEVGRTQCDAKMVGTVEANYIARAMILDLMLMFGRIVLCSINVGNIDKLFDRMTKFVKCNLDVFPTNLLNVKRGDEDNRNVKAQNWSVVKRGSKNVRRSDGGVLTRKMV